MADDSDLPEGTAQPDPVKSEDDLIGDISNLLDDPETDPIEDEDTAKAEDATDEPDEDSEDEDSEDVDDDLDDADDDESDGQSEIKGGRFAPDSAKVKMPDGRIISVKELREFSDTRVKEFQRDYTKSKQELADDRKAIEAQKAEVSQYAQSLNQSREYLAWFAETHMPKKPEPFSGNPIADPTGYLEWQHKQNQWQALNEAYQTFQQQKEAEDQRKTGETQQQAQQRLKSEADALSEAFPVLKNPDKRRGFWDRLETGANKYFGISAEEVRSVSDHRIVKALHAAVKQRRLEEKAPQVREEVKRPVAKSAKRLDRTAQDAKQRQARSERLRRDGTFEAGVAALESFDL